MNAHTIVTIEDNDTDFMTLQHALKAAGVTNPIERCKNGAKAAHRLLSDPEHIADRLCLIMLDLNLPGLDGRELLWKVRALDPARAVPIIVLSASAHPTDIDQCYRAGADAYMVKPLELEDWETKVGQLAQCWLKPSKPARGWVQKVQAHAGARPPHALDRVIEREIVPRLLLAHSGAKPHQDLRDGRLIGDEQVADLTALLFTEDLAVCAAFVESLRTQGATAGSIYVSLLAPAARQVAERWRADRCDFSEFSLALSKLQRLMRTLRPLEGPTKH